jgi:AraC family transcriptional regulator
MVMRPVLSAGNHFGTVTRQWQSKMMTVSRVRYEPHAETPPHSNEQALLVFVESGGYAKEVEETTEFACSENNVLFIPAKHTQADLFGQEQTTCIVVDCDQALLQKAHDCGAEFKKASVSAGAELAAFGVRLAKELKNIDAVSPLVFESLLLHALASSFRQYDPRGGPRVPPWLFEARELLRKRFAESITMEGVAAEVGIHPVNLSQEFRRLFKSTPGNYLRKLRVDFASRQLIQTNLPLVEIAMGAAFADQAHFSRVFRERTGLTPSEYRRHHRNPESGANSLSL